ncbi:hypothetical protein VTN77DRAFT_9311 [Rasamsonia byssochlamydoides]|uniref:uncharacterized protein n=1 Tax=Rasamsonia byssochlamydoides TaxID=89139 RepID=UPI0037448526
MDDSYQKVALGIIVAFPVLGGIAVSLRFWGRRISNSSIEIEDWLILAAYILALGETVTSWYYIKTNYVGIHIWEVPKDYDVKKGQIWNYANQLLYNPILSLVKISVLIFLLRLDSRSRLVHHLIWGTLWFTALLCIAILLADLFQCHPVAFVYDKTIPGGTCINQGAFYVSTAVMTIFTDLLVLSIPILITYSLQMPIRRKIAVVCILSLGGVATGVGCWRLAQLVEAFFPSSPNPDPTYNIGFASSAVEVNTAVIAACGPSMKAIANRFLPRLLGTSKRGGTSGYGKSGTGNRYHRSSVLGYSRNVASNPGPDDVYELGQQYRSQLHHHQVVDVSGPGKGRPRAKTDSPSLSDEDGLTTSIGIVKTTDVSVREENVGDNKTASIDSLV